MTDNNNITNVIRVARGIETNEPRSWRNIETARRLRLVLQVHTSPRDVAREVFKQARATRRANKLERD